MYQTDLLDVGRRYPRRPVQMWDQLCSSNQLNRANQNLDYCKGLASQRHLGLDTGCCLQR